MTRFLQFVANTYCRTCCHVAIRHAYARSRRDDASDHLSDHLLHLAPGKCLQCRGPDVAARGNPQRQCRCCLIVWRFADRNDVTRSKRPAHILDGRANLRRHLLEGLRAFDSLLDVLDALIRAAGEHDKCRADSVSGNLADLERRETVGKASYSRRAACATPRSRYVWRGLAV